MPEIVQTPEQNSPPIEIGSKELIQEAIAAANLEGAANEEGETQEASTEAIAENADEVKETDAPAEPVVETPATEEAPTEPVLSARERFAKAAEEEKAHREENGKLKQWEAKLKERESTIEKAEKFLHELQTDPKAFFEKRMPPTLFEELATEYTQGDRPGPHDNKMSALESKIAQLEKKLEETGTSTQEYQKQQAVNRYMQEVDQAVTGPQFESIREWSKEWEVLTGEKVNLHEAVSQTFMDMQNMYKKAISPIEALEILNEDAQAKLAKIKAYKGTAQAPTQTKEPASEPAATPSISNGMETQSQTNGEEPDDFGGLSLSEYQKKLQAEYMKKVV